MEKPDKEYLNYVIKSHLPGTGEATTSPRQDPRPKGRTCPEPQEKSRQILPRSNKPLVLKNTNVVEDQERVRNASKLKGTRDTQQIRRNKASKGMTGTRVSL